MRHEPQTRTSASRTIARRRPRPAPAAGLTAHDLKNLLTIVLSAAEKLADQLPPGSEAHELAQACLEAADQGATLLERGLKHEDAPRAGAVDCAQVIQTTLRFVRLAAPPAIELWAGAGEAVAARVDRTGLERALLNLCLNAVNAMPEGGLLAVQAAAATLGPVEATGLGVKPGRYARIVVRDNGLGMSPEALARCVEPYFTTGGTGLGLSSVKAFAAISRGALAMTSEQGAGTSASLYLPLAPSAGVLTLAG